MDFPSARAAVADCAFHSRLADRKRSNETGREKTGCSRDYGDEVSENRDTRRPIFAAISLLAFLSFRRYCVAFDGNDSMRSSGQRGRTFTCTDKSRALSLVLLHPLVTYANMASGKFVESTRRDRDIFERFIFILPAVFVIPHSWLA